jgi:glycerophosphoryl diester phosphodiesterase
MNAQGDINRRRPGVIAHRGASAIAPENTLLAFRRAAEAGAWMIETDAHLAQSGQVVLIHDAELARTTDCAGLVSDLTIDDLACCDAGFWFSTANEPGYPFRGQGLTIPTLAETFALLDVISPALRVNVELKAPSSSDDAARIHQLADAVVDEVIALGVVERTLVSSFNMAAIDRVKVRDRTIRTAFLCGASANLRAATALSVAHGHDALHPHHSLLGTTAAARDVVQVIRQEGLEVNVWTVNEPERMRDLAQAGVDGIISDDPARLRAVLESM